MPCKRRSDRSQLAASFVRSPSHHGTVSQHPPSLLRKLRWNGSFNRYGKNRFDTAFPIACWAGLHQRRRTLRILERPLSPSLRRRRHCDRGDHREPVVPALNQHLHQHCTRARCRSSERDRWTHCSGTYLAIRAASSRAETEPSKRNLAGFGAVGSHDGSCST
jgi:hypothetical protein